MDALIVCSDEEGQVFTRMSTMWTLMAIVGAFLCVICHVGLIEFPDRGNSTVPSWYFDGYAICMVLGLISCCSAGKAALGVTLTSCLSLDSIPGNVFATVRGPHPSQFVDVFTDEGNA